MESKKRALDSGDDDGSERAAKRAALEGAGAGAGAGAVAISKTRASALDCPACMELLEFPVDLGCGHTMCEHCLKDWLKEGKKGKVCPTCNKPVRTGDVKNFALEAIIDGMIENMPKEEKQAELDRRLGLAAVHGRPGRMADLLQMGADVDADHDAKVIDAEGTRTALFICCFVGSVSHAECALHLLQAGAYVCNATIFNACRVSCVGQWLQVMKRMLDKGGKPIFVFEPNGKQTSLYSIIDNGVNAELATEIIAAGCPVSGRVELTSTMQSVGTSGPKKPVTLVNPTVADMAAVRGWHEVFAAIIARGGKVTSLTPAVKECIIAQWEKDHPHVIWKQEQGGQGAGAGAGAGGAS